jgi:hypothetical protein
MLALLAHLDRGHSRRSRASETGRISRTGMNSGALGIVESVLPRRRRGLASTTIDRRQEGGGIGPEEAVK